MGRYDWPVGRRPLVSTEFYSVVGRGQILECVVVYLRSIQKKRNVRTTRSYAIGKFNFGVEGPLFLAGLVTILPTRVTLCGDKQDFRQRSRRRIAIDSDSAHDHSTTSACRRPQNTIKN